MLKQYFLHFITSIFPFIKKYSFHFIILLLITLIASLPFWHEIVIKSYFQIKNKNTLEWEVVKSLGYAVGIAVLLAQISISSRRATASEESNLNQRYYNAIEHLSKDSVTARVGAIYNLYYISKSSNAYNKIIFDMFCSHLKNRGNIQKEEKQLIIDKLFRAKQPDRVVKIPKKADLQGVDFTGINFEGAFLRKAIFTGAKLDSCVFDKCRSK